MTATGDGPLISVLVSRYPVDSALLVAVERPPKRIAFLSRDVSLRRVVIHGTDAIGCVQQNVVLCV